MQLLRMNMPFTPLSIKQAERLSIVFLSVYGGLILWLSLRAGSGNPQDIPHIDKLAHFCAYLGYALLAVLWVRTKKDLLGLFLLLFALGVAVELLQDFVPNRDRSILDILANSAGALVGAFLSFKLRPVCRAFFS